ncbi:MAG: hypothetical protein EHM87_03765 [Burkholderiales bacterium]|nr:MAG: hypothetical protein EHM87_03765 [Burkholderiales bacterium]
MPGRTRSGWRGRVALASAVGLVVLGMPCARAQPSPADAARGLFDPPRPAATPEGLRPAAVPWTDGQGADHLRRDAERRARDMPPAARPQAGAPGTLPAPLGEPREIEPAQAEALRRQGERERDARRLRGGLAPSPQPTPRIQPDAPPVLSMPPPPRIAIPQAGEPGGPPIALPTCGPAGCFDANGRAMPSGGDGVLIGPGGRPCLRTGAMATC